MERQESITSGAVFELRREGKIDQAYAMSKQLMKNPNHSVWDKRAYAWCLIDLIKRANSGDKSVEGEQYRNELKQLNIPETEDVLFKQTQYTLALSGPVAKELGIIKSLREKGEHQTALEKVKALYVQCPENDSVKTAYGWCIYKLLQIEAKVKDVNFKRIQEYLDDIFSLGLHNNIGFMRYVWGTLLGIKTIETQIHLYQYALQLDFSTFEKEDYKVKKYTGKDGLVHDWPSLVIRILKKSLDSLNTKVDKEDIISIRDLAVEHMARLEEDAIFLKWSIAKANLMVHELDKAQALIADLLQAKPNEFWLWNGLAKTARNNQAFALACYCKSLLCKSDLKFNGEAKAGIIQSLVELKQYSEASAELCELVDFKTNNDQKISQQLNSYLRAEWYNPDAKKLSKNFYKEHSKAAVEFLCQFLPESIGVVNYITKDQHKAFIVLDGDILVNYQYDAQIPLHEMDVVSVSYTEYKNRDGEMRLKVASCRKIDQEAPVSLVKTFNETIKVIQSGLAFTKNGNILIENKLVQQSNLESDDIVEGIAVRSFNKKKNCWGWKAISIISIDSSYRTIL